MNPIYIPLLSALAGTIIGSLSSIATIVIQSKFTERRERLRDAESLAMEEYRIMISQSTSAVIMPYSQFLHHHIALLKAIEDNELTPDRLRQIAAADDAIGDALIEIDRAWTEKKKRAAKEAK